MEVGGEEEAGFFFFFGAAAVAAAVVVEEGVGAFAFRAAPPCFGFGGDEVTVARFPEPGLGGEGAGEEGLGAPRREDEVEEPLPPAAPPERRPPPPLEPIAAVETLRMTSSRASTRAVCGRQELARSQGCSLAGRGIREAWRSR